MRRRWAIMMTSVLAAGTISACGGDESNRWVIGLDAGSDATRAEIRIENGDDIRTFEADLPWNEELEMPNGSYDITLTVRSLDGRDVGCGIDGPHDPGKVASQMNRESQGGGTVVECRMSGSISSGEYSFEANSEILEEGTGDGAIDDTVPDTTLAPETSTVDTVATAETTVPAQPEDDVTRFLYSGPVLSVQLSDSAGGPDMTLLLQIGAGVVFGEPSGLPNFCIISAELSNARANIDLSPTFGDSFDEMLPDAPDGLVRDERALNSDPQVIVQQLAGEADANVLHGVAVNGPWKARMTVYVDQAALADGTVTMNQVAAALTKILSTFTVDEA